LTITPGPQSTRPPAREPSPRRRGYAPLRTYAAIGDGRTIALVADDGTIDWLPLPNLDSPAVFASVLDSSAGGCFTFAPTVPYQVKRRYLPNTNVLETTFITDTGEARVVDALTLLGDDLGPSRELQRRVEGVAGQVPMRWAIHPRFGYGQRPTRLSWRRQVAVATSGSDAFAVRAFDAGQVHLEDETIVGCFGTQPGSRSLVALCAAHQEPLLFPTRAELDTRFSETIAAWQRWVGGRSFAGPWKDAVIRSALALKLLVHAPSGAVAAAATTSIPEQIGGERNWDYRFCWVRDAAFTLGALLKLGCVPEAQAYFWWLVHASQLTRPRLQPLYRLDGGASTTERQLPLAGYLGSQPVLIGNAAADQRQHDTYGELLQTAWLYCEAGQHIDADIGKRLAAVADLVCRLWREPDSGIWEVRSAPAHFTHSKMMCWVALDRAVRLADRDAVPRHRRAHWCRQADEISDFIEQRCFSEQRRSYVRTTGSDELDASVLLGLLSGYGEPGSARWGRTVESIRLELGHGPYVYRYTGEDGLSGGEGAFVSCSFWLAEALARVGRVADASALMNDLVALGNDVGLYAEELDQGTAAFLGNLPQGLSHLSLISAATAIAEESR
jgi:GH15 family glucan-1,4-alpha-glucosidase